MKKKPSPKRTRTGKQLGLFVKSELYAALLACKADQTPSAPVTGHLETALVEYLTRRGFWPPK